jgi:hypothetical protein
MSNPVLNERTMQNARPPGLRPGRAPTTSRRSWSRRPARPMSDGPVSRWNAKVMTVNGTISATATLLVLLLASAAVGWIATGGPEEVVVDEHDHLPVRHPRARLGRHDRRHRPGVPVDVQAAPRSLRRTDLCDRAGFLRRRDLPDVRDVLRRHRRPGGRCHDRGVRHDARPLPHPDHQGDRPVPPHRRHRDDRHHAVLRGHPAHPALRRSRRSELPGEPQPARHRLQHLRGRLAAFNLALDFDFIERGAQQGLDKHFEWYAAFGLLVTIIWLYLELLRLLAKLRER